MSRYASGTVAGRRLADVSKSQGVKPVLALVKPAAGGQAIRRVPPKPLRSPIGKAFNFGELKNTLRAVPKVARAGFKQGASGAAKPKMGLGAATALHGSKSLQGVGQAGKFVGEHRGYVGLGTGIVGGSVMGHELTKNVEKKHKGPKRYEFIMRKTTPEERRKERKSNTITGGILGAATGAAFGASAGELHYPPRNHGRYGVIGGAVGTGLGALAGHHAPRAEYALDVDEQRVRKAQGDPEDARYARLGAGAAALGAAGAGGVGYAVHDTRRATRLVRPGAKFAANNIKNQRNVTIVEGRGKDKVERQVRMIPKSTKGLADRFSRTGVAMTRRGALAGAGGLAALGGAEALRRRASERRWN